MGDRKVFQGQYFELRTVIMADLKRLYPLFCYGPEDQAYLQSRYEAEGVEFFLSTLPQLGKALDKGLITGTFSAPSSFRRKKGTVLPQLFYRSLTRIFLDSGELRFQPCIDSIASLRQILLFDSKLVRACSTEQLEKAEAVFREGQRSLRKVAIPTDNPVLQYAKSIIEGVFSREKLDTMTLTPNHGPGAVAEGYSTEEKWDFTSWPKKLERLYPYLQYGTVNMAVCLRAGKPIRLYKNCTTKACFVPKDYKGPRLISVEPAAMQYVQQAMRNRVEKILKRYPLNISINLEDQGHNRRLGARAYRDGFSTIDFSTASDLISLPLVWHLFSGVPRWRAALCRLRSDYVGFPTGLERLVAFSPMGSAICFPIQTIVFWALAVATVSYYGTLRTGVRVNVVDACRQVRVFGDDIIVPDAFASDLIRITSLLGMSPNLLKTCVATPFRETCGGEWFDGVDVTFVKNRRIDPNGTLLISHYPDLLDLNRRLYCRGLVQASELVGRMALSLAPVFFTNPERGSRRMNGEFIGDSHVAYSDKLIPFTGQQRWNKDLQRQEIRVHCAIQKAQEWSGDVSEARLLRSLIKPPYSERMAPRHASCVKRAWRAAPTPERASV